LLLAHHPGTCTATGAGADNDDIVDANEMDFAKQSIVKSIPCMLC